MRVCTQVHMKDIANIKIETKRLTLRNLRLDDISCDYIDWLNDPEVNKYLSCAGTLQTMESCKEYVGSYQKRNNVALIGIFLKGNQLHIGNITFSDINDDEKSVAIGISIGRKECSGKGFAKEALATVMNYCFGHLGLNRLHAGINVANTGSLNLFQKCGFSIEKLLPKSNNINGKIQDSYIVSVTKRSSLNL